MADKIPICHWSFLNVETTSLSSPSFASLSTKPAVSLTNLPSPVIQDGKTTVTISEDGYQAGLNNCKHMLLARLHLASGVTSYSSIDLRRKLGLVWGDIGHWSIIPMGRGFFTFNFASDAAVSMVWSHGPISLKPGVIRFMRWSENFSLTNHRNTNAQVWVRLWHLGLQFWEPVTLFEIASSIGVPVKIDQNTLERKIGLYARVLVDVDLSSVPPYELVVRRKKGEDVQIEIEYEHLPKFCSLCANVGHGVTACKQVQKPIAHDTVEHCSQKPRRRRRKVQQIYVQRPKENLEDGKHAIVDLSPNAMENSPPIQNGVVDVIIVDNFVLTSDVINDDVLQGTIVNVDTTLAFCSDRGINPTTCSGTYVMLMLIFA